MHILVQVWCFFLSRVSSNEFSGCLSSSEARFLLISNVSEKLISNPNISQRGETQPNIREH